MRRVEVGQIPPNRRCKRSTPPGASTIHDRHKMDNPEFESKRRREPQVLPRGGAIAMRSRIHPMRNRPVGRHDLVRSQPSHRSNNRSDVPPDRDDSPDGDDSPEMPERTSTVSLRTFAATRQFEPPARHWPSVPHSDRRCGEKTRRCFSNCPHPNFSRPNFSPSVRHRVHPNRDLPILHRWPTRDQSSTWVETSADGSRSIGDAGENAEV